MISHWYIVCFVYFGMCLEGFQVIHVGLIEGMIKQIYLLIGLHWVHGIFFSSSCKCHMVRISLDSSIPSWYVLVVSYCLFDLNEMFDLLHHFTTKKLTKMKNRPPSAPKEFNSLWADRGRFFIFIDFLVVKWCRRSKNENYAKKERNCFTPSF